MMKNSKRSGLIIIILAFILLLAVIFLIIWQKNLQSESPGTLTPTSTPPLSQLEPVKVPTTTPGDKERDYQIYNVSQEAPYQVTAYDAEIKAKLFAERFGSFSNQSNYNNIADLTILMTPSMRTWANGYLAELREQPYSGDYYGIITTAIMTETLAYNEAVGKISLVVTTDRQETRGLETEDPYRQKIEIDLVKTANDWLVDRAYWQN